MRVIMCVHLLCVCVCVCVCVWGGVGGCIRVCGCFLSSVYSVVSALCLVINLVWIVSYFVLKKM